jgi:hypothetical protein
MELKFSQQFFRKTPLVLSVVKIPPVGAEFLHAVGRFERRIEADGRFSQICERTQNAHHPELYDVAHLLI